MTTIDPVWIELRDGRRLAAKVWLPDGAEKRPVPAILEYLPYRRRDGTAARDETTYTAFREAGYAGVRVDIAGSGDSDGFLEDEYDEDELATGEEVIAWIAAQPWCSGAVGMIGISWGGFNGLQIAMRRPLALKAIVTVCSTVDRYADDIHFMGGCLLIDNFTWGAQMNAYMTRPPDPMIRNDWRQVWLARLEHLPFYAANWLRHQRRDALWKHGSVCEDWSAIECAVLAIGGWADAYTNAPAQLLEHLSAPAKALVGPWEHKYPHIARIAPAADFHGEVLRWFDRWLKGAPNGAEALPAYRAYVQDHGSPSAQYAPRPGRWVAEQAWPSAKVARRTLHLSQDGLGKAPGEGEASVATPQHLGQAAGYFCPGMRVENELPEDQGADDALSLCFETLPLDEDFEILGAPELELSVSADRPQALLVFRLVDVAPDGSAARVSYGPFNLAHRDSHETPSPLEPGRRYTVRFRLKHCGHRFRAGHKLRLAVSTTYWPIVWPSPETARVSLYLADCRLHLPQREAEDMGDESPPDPPRRFNNLAAEVLRAPDCRTARETGKDGRHILRCFDDFGATRNPHHGLEVGSSVAQDFSIHPDDPLSARAEARWIYDFRRGPWQARIETENTMTADAKAFHVSRRVTAYEGETKVFDREWKESVPRDCM
jgi:putative CocE/NonD family hydrolase